ncbi:LOG family protein [Marinobacterium weihaiense]|uniref:Cytokinin riboside 5'-monophosphate phosphoribohydrolase n=1 Tax=Marinobacterium weihaiense TaxID=2851016 RepID=A0ABS6MBY8_9GAMM|nr:TIGR00730 family Rossman fold protein [Marinobacterium weihaiense]MBV0933356.1 TIGR00730 family Rossman fold protein [Marinobacterium weihaiense]
MKITVFCGARNGADPIYQQAAIELGRFFAEQEIELVFGGGHVGLMGTIADAVLEAGGRAHGVIPEYLQLKELAHSGLTALEVVPDMHARKARMAELADAFVALPGGIGTLEELFEVWTWGQLGHHAKPVVLYNVDGFYDALLTFVQQMKTQGFLKPEHVEMLQVVTTPQALLQAVQNYRAPALKWSS